MFITVDAVDSVSPFSYKLMLTNDNSISIETIGDELDKRAFTWMKHCLLPKLVKWCDQECVDDSQGIVSNVPSLSLVDIEEYNDLYNELKIKYGLEMVKVSVNSECVPIIHIRTFSSRFGRKIPILRSSFTKTLPLRHTCY